ncbi:MAG TPA: hypothetical protein VK711_04450, partial [Puia sp.]|nr:hypothetical protein [Puia sp.]
MLRIFPGILLFTLTISCQKSGVQNTTTPPTIQPVPKPLKSMIITYPQEHSNFIESQFRFTTDTLNDRFIIDQTDTSYNPAILDYSLFNSEKIYYFSEDLPKRVVKITYRRYLYRKNSGPAFDYYGNYDLDFVYADYSPHPHQIMLTVYQDYSGTNVLNQVSGFLPAATTYYSFQLQDILNLTTYPQTRLGASRIEIWGGTERFDYNDTLDEVFTSTNF